MKPDRILFPKKSPSALGEEGKEWMIDDKIHCLLTGYMAAFELPAKKRFEIRRKILAAARLAVSNGS